MKAFSKLQSKSVTKDQSQVIPILNAEAINNNFNPKEDVKILDDGTTGSSHSFDNDLGDSITIAKISDYRNDQDVIIHRDREETVTALKYEQIVVSATLDVIITDIVSPNYFIIKSLKRDRDMLRIKEIRDIMDNRYSSNVSSISINKLLCGNAYAANFISHWRRIIIDTIGDTNADVHCVDDGIIETIDLNEIKPLFKSVSQIPATAYSCSLTGITHQDDNECWNPDVIDRFKELTKDNSLKAKIIMRDEFGYQIDLFVNNGNGLDNVNQALIADNLCKLSWDPYNPLYKIHSYENMLKDSLLLINQYNQILTRESMPVAIVNVVNPGLFWLQRCDEIGSKYKEDLGRLKVPTMASQHTTIVVGNTYFISCSTTDESYRGLVLKLLQNNQAVIFDIDNGTIDCVNYSNIGLEYNLHNMTPPLAIKCCLYNCKGTLQDGKWNKKSISFFKELASLGNLKAKVISTFDDGTNCVKLEVWNEAKITRIENTLIKQGCASLINDDIEDNGNYRNGSTGSYTISNRQQLHDVAGLRYYNPYTR